MLAVAIYVQDASTLQYNRLDLFDDEKISVTSSIQNINDLSKTFSDFSQTFVVPATKQNNKIFKHWYDNSNDAPFSTLVKSNAFIEIDTILFRSGKIQLESANVVDGQSQDYSITFIGLLGNLKDIFAGLYLKDLTDTTYDFTYSADFVVQKVTSLTPTSPATPDISFPLISSQNYWTYNDGGAYDIKVASKPIRYNELFPAIRLKAVLNMIENRFGINFDGTTTEPSTFLSDAKFTNAFLYLKNADTFNLSYQPTKTIFSTAGTGAYGDGYYYDTTSQRLYEKNAPNPYIDTYNYYFQSTSATFSITPTVSGIKYKVYIYENGSPTGGNIEYTSTAGVAQVVGITSRTISTASSWYWEIYVASSTTLTYTPAISQTSKWYSSQGGTKTYNRTITGTAVSITQFKTSIRSYMPEIKIEDFFSGLLKMFNLTCYSSDGINYTVEQLEDYYNAGTYMNITPYVIVDKKNLNRVKTYKKINFEYEKSQSIINSNFASTNGLEYGSLFYNTENDGDEYSIKLPFEDLNFRNLGSTLQVGYCLKTDYQKYIPKPIILYDYNPTTITTTSANYYLSNSLTLNGTSYTVYRAFGQETIIDGQVYGLNFPEQISTLTNLSIENGLYQNYYEKYFANTFNFKARLIKVSAILPTSKLTSLKLKDTIVIRDEKYIINTMTTDLTSGEVQFELLTDIRAKTSNEPIVAQDIVIGTQTWLDRNFDGTTYNNGDIIPEVTDLTTWNSLTTGAWCYPDGNNANGNGFGKLYNWYAVNDARGIAPSGYRMPTQTDFNTLVTGQGGSSIASNSLRETGTTHWQSPNTSATNSSGFTAVGAGERANNSTDFNYFKQIANFWSSTTVSSNAFVLSLYTNGGTNVGSIDYKYGYSVRFIKI